MVRFTLVILFCTLVGCLLALLGQGSPAQASRDEAAKQTKTKRFRPINPPEWCQKFKRKYYIWTPKSTYTLDEEIPLYIEVLFTGTEPQEHAVFLMHPAGYVDLFRVEKERSGSVPISNGVLWEKPGDGLFRYRGDFIPSEDEIDHSRLHGRLIMPVYHPEHDLTVLESFAPGDCYVMKIKDVRMLWRLFWKGVIPANPFDERGVYRIQYFYSNIIEFEIR